MDSFGSQSHITNSPLFDVNYEIFLTDLPGFLLTYTKLDRVFNGNYVAPASAVTVVIPLWSNLASD